MPRMAPSPALISRRRFLVGDRDERRQELTDLSDQELVAGGRGKRHDLEPIGIAPDDVQRLSPDRSGGTEDRNSSHSSP